MTDHAERYRTWVEEAERAYRRRQRRIEQIIRIELGRGKDEAAAKLLAFTDQVTADATDQWVRAMAMATMYGVGLNALMAHAQ